VTKASGQPPGAEGRFGAVFLLVAGLLFIAGGFWVRHQEARERVTMLETQGTVVDSVKRRDHDNSTGKDTDAYAPVIEFQVNGSPTRFTGSWTSYQQSKGSQEVVRYDPKAPAATARVVDALEGLTPWAVFAMGGAALISGLRQLLKARRASGQAG